MYTPKFQIGELVMSKDQVYFGYVKEIDINVTKEAASFRYTINGNNQSYRLWEKTLIRMAPIPDITEPFQNETIQK